MSNTKYLLRFNVYTTHWHFCLCDLLHSTQQYRVLHLGHEYGATSLPHTAQELVALPETMGMVAEYMLGTKFSYTVS